MTDREWIEMTRSYWQRECWRTPVCHSRFPWQMVKLCDRALGQVLPVQGIDFEDLEYIAVMDADGGNYRVAYESDSLYEE